MNSEEKEAQKSAMTKYWKKQNTKRMSVAMSRVLVEPLRAIRNHTGFTSDDQTLKYLLSLESDLRKNDMIERHRFCKKCYEPINVDLDDCTGVTHRQINAISNCSGNITTEYRVKTGQYGTTTTKNKETETIERPRPLEETDPYCKRESLEDRMWRVGITELEIRRNNRSYINLVYKIGKDNIIRRDRK